MKLLTLSLAFLPVTAFATSDSTVRNRALDTALASTNTAFATAQAAVGDAPLSDGQQRTVSNVLKTKHDTVKNSINNIR